MVGLSAIKRQTQTLDFFRKQLVNDMIAHAYLLSGENDTQETAFYMAQSLFCTRNTDGACGECEACQKIANENHGDFIFISGREKSIKKEDVLMIQERFLQTSLEEVKHKVYIIEDVDNASLVAMNSFLKFLEEPESNIVAILTTSNINRVLETIKSRCLILSLSAIDKKTIRNSLLEESIDEKNAEMLSYLAKDLEDAKRIYASELYKTVVDTFENVVKYIREKKFQEAGICLQVAGIKETKFDLEALSWFCILHEHYYDTQKVKDPQSDAYHMLEVALLIKDRIRPGVIPGMLMDQYAFELSKEG